MSPCCSASAGHAGGPPDPCASASASASASAPPPSPRSCADACCDSDSIVPASDGDGGAGACADACCAGAEPVPVEPEGQRGTCAGEARDACCSKANAPTQGCCEPHVQAEEKDKKSQCCDESCLDELALRKCADEACSLSGSSACEDHKQKTRSKYSASLEALGCICRALLARNLESCCDRTATSTLRRRRGGGRPTSSAGSDGSSRSARSVSAAGRATGLLACGAESGSARSRRPGKGTACRHKCCAAKPPSVKSKACQDDCCASSSPSKKGKSFSEDDCCKTNSGAGITLNVDNVDVERNMVNSEHVVLTVHGMTCTGCETKLMRSLSAIPGITRPQTSLLLSRAEFDLDESVLSAEQIQARLKKETGFNFDKVAEDSEDLETIEVLVENAKTFVDREMPVGIVSVSALDKDIAALQYDPKVVGARELISRSFGSPLELAPLRPPPSIASGRKHVWSTGLKTGLSALLTTPVLIMAWAPLPEHEIAYGSASLAFATIIQVFVAGPFYSSAVRSLVFSRVIEMDLLIVLSTTAAYVFSVVAFAYLVAGSPLSTGEFFETGTLLVTLIMVGRFLSALARQKAVESVSVRSLQVTTALLSSKDGSATADEEVDARLLAFGDVFKVLPETRVPTDGTVISGISEVDESMITGESRPVPKERGAPLVAGSVNGSSVLLARVTRLPGSNTVAKIAAMVDAAKMSKPKIQDMADKVASWFVTVIVAITVLVFVVWVGVGVGRDGMGASDAAVQAITYAIATLIVSCPCAIGLAVPMVVVMASGIAAENGVVVKSAETLEVARKASHIVFDKTGTLTQGKLSVTQEEILDDSSLGLLFGLVRASKHPVSVAVAAHLEAKGTLQVPISDIKSVPGKGVEASHDGRLLRAGNSRWLGTESAPAVDSLLSQGLTVFCFTFDNALHAVFGLADTLRPDARGLIASLRAAAIDVSLVSGDDDRAVRNVAVALDIPAANVRSRASPGDKQVYVQQLLSPTSPSSSPSSSSRTATTAAKPPTILFIGDGTNDSPALATATIGIHMSGGTAMAASAADAVLTADSLAGLPVLLAISRSSFRRICANFAWSFVYNVFAILLAAGAFPDGVRIPPQFAGLGEVVSVLPVIAIAVQMRAVRRWR
ncbi:E1-E2 ATPase-domain-containing protein [Phyllosticta citricarpa]|uniref:E1-E2 ATPase-domain-containing protein n=1 Tax=Phyllosticta citricarpa TaxID=55181 RepID=A0ABR1MBJ2_9PEZI